MIARHMIALKTSVPLALALLAVGYAGPAAARKVEAPVGASSADLSVLATLEKGVENAPQDPNMRAVLGKAYLRTGRFVSAATALGDAVRLGDTSGRTLLMLALAQVGTGQPHEALATLDKGASVIPVTDLGLALALAGDAAKGSTLLADAARAGDSSEKLRANLAYAYALNGQWNEARSLIVADLPADQVDARLTDWAKLARPEAAPERVANLLGVQVQADAGLPARLALAPAAAEAPALAAAPAPGEPAPVASLAVAPAELPAVAVAEETRSVAPTPEFKVVQPASPVAAPVKLAAKAPLKKAKQANPGGHHLVQFGAFLSEQNAAKAKNLALARDKSLSADDVVVAKAVVGGRTFWRVSLAGLDMASATTTCATIRKRGGACFARLDDGALGGAKAPAKTLAMATPAKPRH